MNFYYDELETPLGPMTLLMKEKSIIRLDWGKASELKPFREKWLKKHFPHEDYIVTPALLEQEKDTLQNYFSGKNTWDELEVELVGTPFQKKVWTHLYQSVFYGQTVTYKHLALAAGNEKAVRAVGGAVNKNPLTILVPCHRVIGSDGKLVGYNGGLNKKEYLLELEQEVLRNR